MSDDLRHRPAAATASPSTQPASPPTSVVRGPTRAAFLTLVAGVAVVAGWVLLAAADAFTSRQAAFLVHLGLGVVIVHAFGGGLGTLLPHETSRLRDTVRAGATAAMALVAWLTVVSGTWFVYPGYRAEPPSGTADLTGFPRSFLLDNPELSVWHSFGMEWKEHAGWLMPFLATAVAFAVLRYGRLVTHDGRIRRATTAAFVLAFGSAVVAALLGAVINIAAPTTS